MCDASDFQTMSGGPGYYTPFDDSSDGWRMASLFIDWLSYPHSVRVFGVRSGFNEANLLARQHPEKFIAWYAMLRLEGK